MAVHYIEKAKCEQMREDSIRRILTAAMHLFADNGYTATTMQMIAREANLVPSGIYHYFSVSGRRDIFIQQVEDLKSRRETLLFSRLPLPVTAEIPI